MPRLLGPAVALGSVAYLLDSVGRLLFPDGGPLAAVVPACMVVSTVAELAMVGWLLFFGIREPASALPAAAHAA